MFLQPVQDGLRRDGTWERRNRRWYFRRFKVFVYWPGVPRLHFQPVLDLTQGSAVGVRCRIAPGFRVQQSKALQTGEKNVRLYSGTHHALLLFLYVVFQVPESRHVHRTRLHRFYFSTLPPGSTIPIKKKKEKQQCNTENYVNGNALTSLKTENKQAGDNT
jgi:hypothetical protein